MLSTSGSDGSEAFEMLGNFLNGFAERVVQRCCLSHAVSMPSLCFA